MADIVHIVIVALDRLPNFINAYSKGDSCVMLASCRMLLEEDRRVLNMPQNRMTTVTKIRVFSEAQNQYWRDSPKVEPHLPGQMT